MSSGLSATTRWRLLLLLTAATASALIAGCCGGPLSADGNCTSCDCPDEDAGPPIPTDAGDDAAEAASDASDDAD